MTDRESYEEALEILSRKWSSRIVECLLTKEKAKFNELKKEIDGISNKSLSESLKNLEERDLVEKVQDDNGEAYALTEKGKSLEKVLNSIKRWSRKFSEDSSPRILVIEDEGEQAELYSRWLEPEYSVSTANSKLEFYEEFDEQDKLVLLDRDLRNSTAKELIEESERLKERPIILITGKEPGDEIIDLDIADYLLKPISKEQIKDRVSQVIELGEKDDELQELASLLHKKEVLERSRSGKGSEEYEDLLKRIDELRQEIDETKLEELKT